MDEQKIPSFVKPPVTEVAIGVTLPPIPIQTRHIGQFWSELRDEYPFTEDAPPVLLDQQARGIKIELLTIPPLRRVFMLTENGEFIVQIQESKFLHNWRRSPAETEYPRYGAVLGRFLSVWEKYSDFLERVGIGEVKPIGYELTYVNELGPTGENQIGDLVKPLDWTQLGPEFLIVPPQATNISWSFALPENKGSMNVTINRGANPGGDGQAVLVLSCQGPSSDSYSLQEWFDTAHVWIVKGFADLTTQTAHKAWQREA